MMFNSKKIIVFLLINIVWVVVWIMITISYDSYRDPILNYVPHSNDYLTNEPTNQLVPKAKKPKHVVMVGIDGMASYALKSGYSPNMNYLMHHGAYTLETRDVLPTSSAANWASVMFATDPIKHGVVDQDLWNINHTVHAEVKADQVSIFSSIIDKYGPSKNLFGYASEGEMIANFQPKGQENIKTLISNNGNYCATENDKQTFENTKNVLINKPLFSFFYYVNPDLAGHSREWNSEEYYQAISQTDKYIGGIIENLKDLEMWEDTLLIISSDHGGVSQYHGHSSDAEQKIPLLFAGNCIPKYGIIPDKIKIYDIPATIAWLLDINSRPIIWDGQPILTPFFDMTNMYDHSEEFK